MTRPDDAAHQADADDDQGAGDDPDLTHTQARRAIGKTCHDEERTDQIDDEVKSWLEHPTTNQCKSAATAG